MAGYAVRDHPSEGDFAPAVGQGIGGGGFAGESGSDRHDRPDRPGPRRLRSCLYQGTEEHRHPAARRAPELLTHALRAGGSQVCGSGLRTGRQAIGRWSPSMGRQLEDRLVAVIPRRPAAMRRPATLAYGEGKATLRGRSPRAAEWRLRVRRESGKGRSSTSSRCWRYGGKTTDRWRCCWGYTLPQHDHRRL